MTVESEAEDDDVTLGNGDTLEERLADIDLDEDDTCRTDELRDRLGLYPSAVFDRGIGVDEPDDVTPHTLRHSVAYRLIQIDGCRLGDVQLWVPDPRTADGTDGG